MIPLQSAMEATFALHALMEIPDQFKAISRLRLLGRRVALPPSAAVNVLDPLGAPPPVPAAGGYGYGQYGAPSGAPGPMMYGQQPPFQGYQQGGYGGAPPGYPGYYPGYGGPAPPPHPYPGYGAPGANPAPFAPTSAPGPGFWACPSCTMHNHVGVAACVACGTPASAAVGSPAGSAATSASMARAPLPGSAPAPAVASSNGVPSLRVPTAATGSGGAAAAANASAAAAESARLRAELEATREAATCPICMTNRKDTVFNCGHSTCGECGATLRACPVCRVPITSRIKTYG